MDPLFQGLRPFVWPKYREEGPPEFVQGILTGRDFLGGESDLSTISKSILELMLIGYRPATSIAVLTILTESPKVAMHGMQIARELEKRFDVQEGWFTKTRYYSDRVGRLLTLLQRLEMIQEVQRKDHRTGRTLTTYMIHPDATESIKDQIATLAKGETISLFPKSPVVAQASAPMANIRNPRVCPGCQTTVISAGARYCERCGRPLEARCETCGSKVEAIYDFCLNCGGRIT